MPESQISRPSTVRPAEASFDRLALVLEGRHGIHAADVADFFSSVHDQLGDQTRSLAWEAVADTVRRREAARVSDAIYVS